MAARIRVRTRKGARGTRRIRGAVGKKKVGESGFGECPDPEASPDQATSQDENGFPSVVENIPTGGTSSTTTDTPREEQEPKGLNFYFDYLKGLVAALFRSKAVQDVSVGFLEIYIGRAKRNLAIKTPRELTESQMVLWNRHYELVYTRAQDSFRNATIASYLGLFILAAAIFIGLAMESPDAAIATAVGGAIVELISVLFMAIYSKSLEQLNRAQEQFPETFDKLLANQLAEGLPRDEKYRSWVKIIDQCLAKDNVKVNAVTVKDPPPQFPQADVKPNKQPVWVSPELPASATQFFGIFAIYILVSLLALYEILPSAFLPVVISFLGLVVLANITPRGKNKETDYKTNLLITANSLFMGYSFWYISDSTGVGVIVFFLALIVQLGWLFFPKSKRSRAGLILAMLAIVLVVFLMDQVFMSNTIGSRTKQFLSYIMEGMPPVTHPPENSSRAYLSTTTEETICYSSTSQESDVVARIPQGDPITFIGENPQNDWIYIRWNTIECWIPGRVSFLPIVRSSIQTTPIVPPPILPTASIIPTLPELVPPPPIEIYWNIDSYDCLKGKVIGVTVSLEIKGGISPYTTVPDLPVYVRPGQSIEIAVYSNTADGEPSSQIALLIPDGTNNKYFNCK